MDAKLITVEGRMVGQNLDQRKHYKLAFDMSIYARPSHRSALEPELAWATPGQRGFEAMRQAASGAGRPNDTGLSGTASSGVGLPGKDWDEVEMKRLLDNLKKVEADEKQVNGVMVSANICTYLYYWGI